MKQKTSIWGSVSLLIGVVIAILAIVRGRWQLPLLVGVFVVWDLWLLWTQAIPAWRTMRARPQKEQPEVASQHLVQTLLHHVNYRISASLKAGYPDARWEWMMHDPARFVSQGGTGRIRVYGIPDYEFAEVTLDQSGKLSCSLVKLAPVQSAAGNPVPPNQQEFDPQVWYDTYARQTLEHLVADLDSRGHSGLALKEDGSICTRSMKTGKEVPCGTLAEFPSKERWSKLADVLEQRGLTAAVRDTCIAVSW